MNPARLVVVAGADAGTTLELSNRPRFLLFEGGAGEPKLSMAEEAASGDDRRVAALQIRGDFAELLSLHPSLKVTLNGKQVIARGERAVVRHGDVVGVGAVALRLQLAVDAVADVHGSGPYATVPAKEVSSRIIKAHHYDDAALFGFLSDVANRDVDKVRDYLEVVQQVGKAALRADSPTALLVQVLQIIGRQFPKAQGSILWRVSKGESFRRVARLGGKSEEVRVSRTVMRHVLETREGVVSEDTALDQRLSASQSIKVRGMSSVLCVPIIREGAVAGIIHLDHAGRGKFTDADLAVVSAAGGSIATALDTMDERMAETTAAVGQGVRSALRDATVGPTPPGGVHASGLHMAVALHGDNQAAGIFAEALALDPSLGSPVVIGLGEINGETLASALGALRANTVVRTMAPLGHGPDSILGGIGRILMSSESLAMNALIARWDPKGQLALAGTGRVSAVHHSAATGETNNLSPQTPHAVALAPGDTVVLFTEGLVGSIAKEDPELMTVRNMVVARGNQGPAAVVDALLEQARLLGQPGPAGIVAVRRD